MGDVFPIYEKLWARAQADGIWVHYDGLMGDGLAGYFHPRDHLGRPMKPEIAILRPYYKSDEQPSRESNAPADKPQPNIVEELITLAHEYGHSRSWAGRTPRDEYRLYDAAVKHRDAVTKEAAATIDSSLSVPEQAEQLRRAVHARMTDDQRARIVAEEELAWTSGREVLVELGLTDFALYDERARIGVHNHRYRLGMEDLAERRPRRDRRVAWLDHRVQPASNASWCCRRWPLLRDPASAPRRRRRSSRV